jgi:hypothetical protein
VKSGFVPKFTVSLIASIPVSAKLVIDADNEAAALAIAAKMQSRSQLSWTYNNSPIPSFNGQPTSIWTNPGVPPSQGPRIVDIVLVVSPTTVVFGSPVSATVTIAPGATGLVRFYDELTLIGTATPNGFGVATLSDIILPSGIQRIVANFAGDSSFAEGVSNIVNVNVTLPVTITTISATPNPQDFGSPVVITATVTSGAGMPTGLVRFYDNATQIGVATLSSGTCSITTSALTAGTHTLTAVYQGTFAPSTSAPFSEVINSVILIPSVRMSIFPFTVPDNPSELPNPSVFTATVTNIVQEIGGMTIIHNSANVATDFDLTAQVMPGNQLIFNSQPDTVYTVLSLTSSVITLTGVYTGTTNYYNTTGTYNQVQPTGNVQFQIALSPGPAVDFGSPVALALVAGTPTATVSVRGGAVPALADGTYYTSVVYLGDSNYAIASPNGPTVSPNLVVNSVH